MGVYWTVSRFITMWAGSLLPRWTPFSQRAISRLIPAWKTPGTFQMDVKDSTKFASSMYTNNKGEFKYSLFQCEIFWIKFRKLKNLSAGCSSVSAPTGPTGCWGTSDPRRNAGSGTKPATGKFAGTARDCWARFRSLPEHGRRLASTRPALFGGSPDGDRRTSSVIKQHHISGVPIIDLFVSLKMSLNHFHCSTT